MPALLLAATLTAGCETAVAGSAVPVRSGSARPSPTTQAPPAKRTTLSCAGDDVVRPRGAPYCYLLPGGFTDATDQLTLNYQSPNPSEYESAVAVAVHDVIIVAVYPLREDSDSLSDDALSDEVNLVLRQGESSGFTVTGQPTPTTVDENRAFRIPIKQKDGQYTSTIYFVFRGFTEIEINCQYARQRAAIERGCAGLLRSIQIVDLPR